MIRASRLSLTRKLALIVACAACALTLPIALAAGAESTVRYQKESLQSYERQLAAGRVQAVTINKRVRSLHVTLGDARHVLAKYAAHEEAKMASALEAKGVPVTVLKPAAAAREASSKPVHHKLRYIAGGILVVVIVVVGAVLLLDRRRKLAAE
jgi:hypothetical protein